MTDQRSPLSTYLPTPAPIGPGVPKPVERPTLSQVYDAGITTARADLPTADVDRVYNGWRPIVDELNRDRSWFRRYHTPGAVAANSELYLFDEDGHPVFKAPSVEDQEKRLWSVVEARRAVDPKAFPGVPKTLDDFHAQILTNAKSSLKGARDVLARNDRWAGTAAQVGAGVVTGFRDQYQIMALPLGGMGRSMAMRVVTAGLGNMAVEAVEQPMIADQREKLGETMTTREKVLNVAAAGVFGGGLQAIGEVAEPIARAAAGSAPAQAAATGVTNAFERGRAMAQTARERIGWANMTPPEKVAVLSLERDADIAATSPFKPGPGTDAHVDRIEATVRGLKAGDGLPPAPAPKPFDANTYAIRVGRAENSGHWQGSASTSSAYGLYQITKGTWERLAQGRMGLSWSNRTNPAAQESIFTALTRENRQALARAGAPETYGNLYLAHFAGSGAATKILKAAPDTPIERILSAKAIEANAFLRGKTADDMIRWAHAKMGETPHEGPVLSRAGFDEHDAGDAEWRAAQAEVDTVEREMAAARRADVAEAMPARIGDDEVPFDLADTRAPSGPKRDPFADLPEDMGDIAPARVDGEDAPAILAPLSPARSATTLDDARTAVRPMVGTKLVNAETGIDATLSGNTLSKMTSRSAVSKSRSAEDHALAVANADALFERAGLERSHPDRKGDPNIVAIHRFRTGMEGVDGPVSVKLTVKETQGAGQPNPLYSIEAVEVEPGRLAPEGIERAPEEPDAPRTGPRDDIAQIAREDNAGADTPPPIAGFDHPDDFAATRQIDSMAHDLKMLLEEQPDLRIRGEDGADQSLAEVLADLDADEAAIDAARRCM